MSGTLYVVATPIGNLEDITLRALRILREVAVIAAEDTRRTAKLLAHHGITTRTLSFHDHNAHARTPQLLKRLQAGESIALVSDAGTPGVSDPGLELVRACIDAGVPVDALPGPSAMLTALVASGFPAEPVTFLGFAPNRASTRTNWLARLAAIPHTVIFFEAPHRIQETLTQAGLLLGERLLYVGRELTKLHQEHRYGTAKLLGDSPVTTKGEFTVVVGPNVQSVATNTDALNVPRLVDEFRQLTESGNLTRREAISALAQRYSRSSKEIYASLEAAKRT